MGKTISPRVSKLIGAFEADGFLVDPDSDVIEKNGKFGIRATHQTATIGRMRKKKQAFYIEGDAHTMGYLMGILAEPIIQRMCTEFNQNIVFDFINVKVKDEIVRKILGDILEDIVNLMSKPIYQDVPNEYLEEIEGMLDGCREVNGKTKADRESLWVLNVGFDALLAFVYTGLFPHKKKYPIEVKPTFLNLPICCNAFSAFGRDPQTNADYHYFGRDFMFPTADVYQDTACLIIRNPENGLPTVSVAAPGMIGTIAGLNKDGVGVGLDMLPGSNCDPKRPGFNSLLLTRHCIQYGENCDQAVETIINAPRGITWNYVLADGSSDKSCVVEAGMKQSQINYLDYIDEWALRAIRTVDPNFAQRLNNLSTPQRNGVMVRWNEYSYPSDFLDFNPALIAAYKQRNPKYAYQYDPADFSKQGYLNKSTKDKNCPGLFYFAPQKEKLTNVIVVTNHQIIPEMRLCSMNDRIEIIAATRLNDIQWRYDELNNQLLTILDKGYMTYGEAKEAIDFLAPYGRFPKYYNKNNDPLNQVQIHGSVSLMDLKAKTIESHYGYFGDEWVKIRLENYL